jgi:hypothetical protein
MKRFAGMVLCCLFLSLPTGTVAHAEDNSTNTSEVTKSNYSEGLRDAAIVIGAGVTGGGVPGAAIAAGVIINDKLDKANEAADKYNDQMDQKLKDQKAELCKQTGQYCQ